jgi:hypothetical protein
VQHDRDIVSRAHSPSTRDLPKSTAILQVPLGWPDGSSRAALSLVSTPVVSEARAAFAPWGSVVLRLWRGADEVEVEWTVGPVPIEDGVGKEVMLRLRSDIDSGAALMADSVRLAGFWSDVSRVSAAMPRICYRVPAPTRRAVT